MRVCLVLCVIVAQTTFAGDILSHGVQGFLVTAVSAKALGADRETAIGWGIAGGILGMEPDLAGFYGNRVLRDNWATYSRHHSGNLAISFLPPVRLHLWVDGLFTHGTGESWWPKDAWKEVLMIAIETTLMYLVFKYILRDK